jgi:hypothetical protein
MQPVQTNDDEMTCAPVPVHRLKQPSRWRVVPLGVWLVLTALVVFLQWRAGAFSAEFSTYPDEAAHYLSGVLVHDYVSQGFSGSPIRFAENFYFHYPYIGIGHWPPGFYLVEGLWMLVFSTSRVSVLLLMAVITSTLAVGLFRALREEFGWRSSVIAAGVLVCVPLVQRYTSSVMLETLVALFSFWAIQSLGQYVDSGRWQDSVKFAVFSSMAILTKGNGFALAMAPPLAVLLSRRFHLLKRWGFWVPALIVGPLCAPWNLFTLHLVTPTWSDHPSLTYALRAVTFYGRSLVETLGVVLIGLAFVGIAVRIVKPLSAGQVPGKWAAAAAFLLGTYIFLSVASAGIEVRFLVPAIAPAIMLAVPGARHIAGRFPIRFLPGGLAQDLLLLLVALLFSGNIITVPAKASFGFKTAVDQLAQMPQFQNSVVLVSSGDRIGEGIFIAEVAMRDRSGGQVVLRADKVLADSNWLGTDTRPLYSGPSQIMPCLEAVPVDFIVLDNLQGDAHFEHHRQLLELVTKHPEWWRLLGVANASTVTGRQLSSVYIYGAVNPGARSQPGQSPSGILTSLGRRPLEWPISVRLVCPAQTP